MKTEGNGRKKKKRKKKRYLLKLAIIVLIGSGLYFLLSSSLFDIEKITVKNNHYHTPEQVVGMTRVKTGGNIFAVSLSDMKDKLISEPYIKNAKLKRKLPDAIEITIEERQEYLAIPYGSDYIITDRDGLVLRKTEVEPALTQLLGMTVKSIKPGKPLEVEENGVLTETLRLLHEVENHEIYFKKVELGQVVIKAYIYEQLICEGSPEIITANLESLNDVLYDLYKKGIERGMIKMGGDGYFSFSPLVE